MFVGHCLCAEEHGAFHIKCAEHSILNHARDGYIKVFFNVARQRVGDITTTSVQSSINTAPVAVGCNGNFTTIAAAAAANGHYHTNVDARIANETSKSSSTFIKY